MLEKSDLEFCKPLGKACIELVDETSASAICLREEV